MDFVSELATMWCYMLPFILAASVIGMWLRRKIKGDTRSQSHYHHTPPQSSSPPPQSTYTPPSYDSKKDYDDRPDWAKIEEREAEQEKRKEDWENSLTKKIKDFFFD